MTTSPGFCKGPATTKFPFSSLSVRFYGRSGLLAPRKASGLRGPPAGFRRLLAYEVPEPFPVSCRAAGSPFALFFDWSLRGVFCETAFSVSHSGVDAVAKYIANQEEHHRKKSFRQESFARRTPPQSIWNLIDRLVLLVPPLSDQRFGKLFG